MAFFGNSSESRGFARKAASRLVERAHDAWWSMRRPRLPMVLLKDQRPLGDRELRRAHSIIDWIAAVIEARPAYLKERGLDPKIHFPQAIWALDDGVGLFDGFRALLSRDPRVLNYLRLWSQQFTGYRLLSMELAEQRPFPNPEEINAAADQRLLAFAGVADRWVGRYSRLARKLPPHLRVSPPRRFGEVGWELDGRTVSYDSYVYLERIALLHECGLLDRLKQIAATGRTPLIVEIGGGFGGLAYHLAQQIPQARIVIVDIPESLIYSSVYLSLLFPERTQVYAKPEPSSEALCPDASGFTFVPNFLFDNLVETGTAFDLAINTLSMSEMNASQVEFYCRGLRQLLGPEGVFFEQNQNNKPHGWLDARTVIAGHFEYRHELSSRLVGNLTQGTAHVWSKQPHSARPYGLAGRRKSVRMVPVVREMKRPSTASASAGRTHANAQ